MERWEVFLRALAERVAVANETNLTTRCWKHSTLGGEIKTVIKANQKVLRVTFPSARDVIEQLIRMGWIYPVTVQSPKNVAPLEFILLDREGGKGDPINPLELLQAFLPNGVVSYFSAIGYYELTTQPISHHHIARLGPAKLPKRTEPGPTAAESRLKTEVLERNPLGTELFHFADAGYYLNRRDASLAPGIQSRVVTPRCWLRITTLEQTLLDGLMQPIRCGGEAVVMEAWETGGKQIDAERLAEHLGKIQREDLDRRVGAMAELLGLDFSGSALESRLQAIKSRLPLQSAPEIPLLAGLAFSGVSRVWQVQTP